MIPTDEIIKMAREAGIRRFDIIECRNGMPHVYQGSPEALAVFAALVSTRAAATEREACAKVCEEIAPTFKKPVQGVLEYAAGEIRTRGEQHEH